MGRHVPWEWAWYLARGDARTALSPPAPRRRRVARAHGAAIRRPRSSRARCSRTSRARRRAARARRCRRATPRRWLERSPRLLAALARIERARCSAAAAGGAAPTTTSSKRRGAPHDARTPATRHAVPDRALQLALRHLRLLAARPRDVDARVGAAPAAASSRRCGTRTVLLSGGEPLLQSANGREIAALLRAAGLRPVAADLRAVARQARAARGASCSSRSPCRSTARARAPTRRSAASTRSTRCARAFAPSVAAGVPVGLRVTLQRANYRELPRFVTLARELGASQVSFLAVDVSNPHAFARRDDFAARARAERRRSRRVRRAARRRSSASMRRTFAARFIAESPAKLRRIRDYFAALLRAAARFPPVRCNAPEFSAVVGVDGRVSPCFFIPGAGARTARAGRSRQPGQRALRDAARARSAPASAANARRACARCGASRADSRDEAFRLRRALPVLDASLPSLLEQRRPSRCGASLGQAARARVPARGQASLRSIPARARARHADARAAERSQSEVLRTGAFFASRIDGHSSRRGTRGARHGHGLRRLRAVRGAPCAPRRRRGHQSRGRALRRPSMRC